MQKFLCGFLVGLCCLCGWRAGADYLNPPDWGDSNDFTHQSWDFLTDQTENLPNVPPDGDPNWINDFGQPFLISVDFNDYIPSIPGAVGYKSDLTDMGLETDRQGYYGGMGNVMLTFRIPNLQRPPLWQKQIWIQMAYLARNDGGKTYDIDIATDPNFTDANVPELAYLLLEEPNEPNNPPGRISQWYRLTVTYVMPDQPAEEYIRLATWHYPIELSPPMGGAAVIDEVDIDTRSITPDLFADGIVNFRDFAVVAGDYGRTAPQSDLYPDNSIDFSDIEILLGHWLEQDQVP